MGNQIETFNNRKPLVSVGMPVYNVEPYIEKSIISVLNQTYENVEILVVDDCGTDGSMDIVRRFQKEHPRGNSICIIQQPHNMGQGEARNVAIKNANGKYLYLLDSDDYIEPTTLELMVPEAEANNADVVHTVARTVYSDSGKIEQLFPDQPYRVIKGKDEFANVVCADLRRHVSFCCWNILYNLDFLRRNNLYFYKVKCEDVLFFSDYYSEVECAVMMPDVTYNYLVREGSTMGYMKRKVIPVRDIRMWFDADFLMIEHAKRLQGRVFYDVHCARVMKWNFRAVCVALRHRKRFDGPLKDKEIAANLHHPSTFLQICKFKRYKAVNLFFKIMGMLPAWLCVRLSYVIGKIIRWI